MTPAPIGTALLFLILILAFIGAVITLERFTRWLMTLIAEAEEKNKRIEFSSVIVAIIALLISMLSFIISLNTSSSSTDLNKRLDFVEMQVQRIPIPTQTQK